MCYVNYIPERLCLVLDVRKKDPYDLALLLKQYKVQQIAIYGTPNNVSAISASPQIEDVNLDRYERPDLKELQGLKKLRRFSAGFGHLVDIELDFCSATLAS